MLIVSGEGWDGNIGLGIKRYHPEHVECGGKQRFEDECKKLVVSPCGNPLFSVYH